MNSLCQCQQWDGTTTITVHDASVISVLQKERITGEAAAKVEVVL